MLARGLLCRLAADASKPSTTHDLPQLARLVQRNVLARNSSAAPTALSLARACRGALFEYRRSYATTTRARKPTTKVKSDVKKATAKKATTKKAPAKKTTKGAAKKSKPKKAAVKKPQKEKKELTPEAAQAQKEKKEKQEIAELRKKALKSPIKSHYVSAWNVYAAESLKNRPEGVATTEPLKNASTTFQSITPAEKEHYNHLANQQTEQRKADYTKWLHTYTPDQIRLANNARALLKRKLKNYPKHPANKYTQPLEDDRLVKRPNGPFARFVIDRHTTGDLKGISVRESAKLLSNEWKSLNASEKKVYEDSYAADHKKFLEQYEQVYGHTPRDKTPPKSS